MVAGDADVLWSAGMCRGTGRSRDSQQLRDRQTETGWEPEGGLVPAISRGRARPVLGLERHALHVGGGHGDEGLLRPRRYVGFAGETECDVKVAPEIFVKGPLEELDCCH